MTDTLDRDDPAGLAHALDAVLRQRILTGDLPTGARVPSETELADEFGVSRTVVREAISRLRAAGLVETQQGRGSYVLTVPEPAASAEEFPVHSREDLVQLMELRLGVESESAALAARRGTPAQVASVRRAVASFARAASDPAALVEVDFAFHVAVAEAAGNRYIVDLLGRLGPRAIMLHRTQLGEGTEATSQEHLDLLVHEHRAIADAIARGDADAARSAMRVHLLRSLHALG